jgi:hypothetical protein
MSGLKIILDLPNRMITSFNYSFIFQFGPEIIIDLWNRMITLFNWDSPDAL